MRQRVWEQGIKYGEVCYSSNKSGIDIQAGDDYAMYQ